MVRSASSPDQIALASLQTSLDELAALIPSLGDSAKTRVMKRLDELAIEALQIRAKMPKAAIAITKTLLRMVETLSECGPQLNAQGARSARAALATVEAAVAQVIAALDPIRTPLKVFDPALPDAAGKLVAIALLAQPRLPLGEVGQMYGSGCYAIYYRGDHPYYAAVAGSETPIYVGKADPEMGEARNPREQGPKLTGRLLDHRRMIQTVERWATEHPDSTNHPLHIQDFEYRRLVVATNAQLVAEQCLIGFFRPLWNNETSICWGISKHGDSAGTRANKRSPWDVLHPGRSWAMDTRLSNSREPDEILADINVHFEANPPYRDTHEIIDKFLREFAQDAVERGASDDASDEETEREAPEA